jgi:hypothetical protein
MATNEKEFDEYIDPIVDILPMNLSYAEKLKLLKDRFQLPKDYLDLPNDPLTTSILQSTMEKARIDANNPKYDYESTGYWPSFKANKQGDKMIQQLEVEDPGLILRSAAITNKNRRDRNMDTAAREYAQAQDDFDRTFNPTDYGRRRSGRVMPLGGRAGMMNLYRPQYNADMNQSINADENVVLDNKRLKSANSLEAERNKAKGFLGINKRDDGSTYFTGSEQVRQNLEKSIADYDKEIAKLQAEIAMSEAGDPMYDLAVMRMVMNDDMSLMNDIRGRIGKKIDQEFQMKQNKANQEFQHEENELNRENTLDVAKMNREQSKQDKIDAAQRNAKRHRAWIGQLIDQFNATPTTENRLALVREWLDLQDAATEAGYSKIEEFIGADDYATIMDALGMTVPGEADDAQNSDGSVLTFKNSQDFKNEYNSALRKAKTDGNFEPVKNILSNVGTLISKDEISKYEGEIETAEEVWKNDAPAREVRAIQKEANEILAKLRRKEIDSNTAVDNLKKLRTDKIDVRFKDVYEDPDKATATVTRKGN